MFFLATRSGDAALGVGILFGPVAGLLFVSVVITGSVLLARTVNTANEEKPNQHWATFTLIFLFGIIGFIFYKNGLGILSWANIQSLVSLFSLLKFW